MKPNILKAIRVIVALLLFIPITLFFCDFMGIFPHSLHVLEHIQLVPAIMTGKALALVLLLLTFLFGRVYCSTICPLGVLQDIISWFSRRGKKNQKPGKNKKKRWFHYSRPYSIVRYTLLTVCVVSLLFGITAPTLFLDPYSNFGRIAANVFRPLAMEGNNILNWIALKFDNYSFHQVTIYTVTTLSFTVALITFLAVGVLSFLRGRLFCNTICPVGALLGLVSRFSLFGVKLNPAKCTQCSKCAQACKAECIDYKNLRVDNSRCVDCFNCLDRCKNGAITYQFRYSRKEKKKTEIATETKAQPVTVNVPDSSTDSRRKSRRQFLATSAAIGITAPLLPSCLKISETDISKLSPITPPGSRSLKHFADKCTACHLCITHCPQQILKPAGFTFGVNYAFKPHLSFYGGAFCNYNCTVCSQVCPNGAIERITREEKKEIQIGVAKFNKESCVVYTYNSSCGACSEHCPTQAVRMEPYKDGLTIPHVYEELCIGCGGCESICPVRPVKAINVLANEVHGKATLPSEEEVEEIDLDALDWGF